ncbi:glycosyltransferase family 2 protein [Priestia aryabhattai]
MKDIHVLIVNYTVRSDLNKALASLAYISDQVKKVTVFDCYYPYLSKIPGVMQFDIEHIDAGNDLGMSLNIYLQTITTEYVLFLFNHEVLTAKSRDILVNLTHHKSIINVQNKNKDSNYFKPLTIKTAFLKQTPFLLEREVPFKEMIFHLWVLEKSKLDITTLRENVIEEIRNINNITNQEKLRFAHKLIECGPKIIKPNPTLSVMISNYNMVKFLSVAIQSCFMQTIPFDQIIVIDDGSTDESLSMLEKWNSYPNVKLFYKQNEGKAKALNYIVPFVTSDFVLELDADDWLDPDAVFLIKSHLENIKSNISLLYGNWRYWNQKAKGEVEFSKVRKGKPINNSQELLSYPLPLGPRIYRTSILKEEGGFPIIDFEQGRLYEDVSVLFNFLKKYEFSYRDFTVYNVRKHKDSITKKNHSKWNDFKRFLT